MSIDAKVVMCMSDFGWLNVERIAEITEIDREDVEKSVRKLCGTGFLQCDECENYYLGVDYQ